MRPAMRAFAGGEVSPSFYARVDLERYLTSLRTCRNFIVQQDGGLVNRPGTLFVSEIKDSSAAGRLIKYVNDTDRYIMELGDGFMRFYKNHARVTIAAPTAWATATAYVVGDLVSQGGVNYYCKLAHTSATGTDKPGVDAGAATKWYALTSTIYEIPTPYTTADLANIQYTQNEDTIRIVCAGKPRYELKRYTDTKWIISVMSGGPQISGPTGLALAGGSAGATYYWAVTAVMDNTFEESLPSYVSAGNRVPSAAVPTTVTWGAVTGAISYNIYRSTDGETYEYIGSIGGQATARTDNTWGDATETATSSVQGVWTAAAGGLLNALGPISATQKARDGNYEVTINTTLSSGVATAGLTRGRFAVYYKRNTDAVRVFVTYIQVDSVTGPSQTDGPKVNTFSVNVPDDGYTSLQLEFVPEVQPGAGGSNCSFQIDGTDVKWTDISGTFNDENQTSDKVISPPKSIIDFDAVNDYPTVIGHYQQRGLYANTPNGRTRFWASKIGSLKNFCYSTPLLADDPVAFKLDGRQSNPIRHLLDLGRLVIFTTESELILEGNESGVLRPDAVNIRTHSYNGASKLVPLVINDRALYVQARGGYVRMIHPADREGSQNINLSLLASHLFRGYTLVDWDFAQVPNSIVWAVRSDGALLGCTFITDQREWGWHRHDTDGTFENVCVIPASTNNVEEDVPYFIVKRTINGATKRYIEYMPTRYYNTDPTGIPFSDSALAFGTLGSSIVTVDHLRGKSISAREGPNMTVWASPNNPAYGAAKVVDVGTGQVDVSTTNKPVVGLPIIYDLQPLDIDTPDGRGIKHGRLLVSRVVLHLDRTPSLWAGLPENPTSPSPLNGLQPLAVPLDAQEKTDTTDGVRSIVPTSSWRSNGRFLLRQVDPVPVTILMVSPEFVDAEK